MYTRIHIDHFSNGSYEVDIDGRHHRAVTHSSIQRLDYFLFLFRPRPEWRIGLTHFPDMTTEIFRPDKATS